MMSGNEGEQPRRLLQEELTRFKRRRGAQISKGGGARSPFPVTVRFVVETPRTFAYYDVEAIGVEVAIDETGVGVEVARKPSGDPACFSSRVTVTDPASSSLPISLRNSIAALLQKFLDDGHKQPSRGGRDAPVVVGLERLAEHVEVNFGALLSTNPALLESYLVSNPVSGRSERRMAVLDEDVEVAIDVSVDAVGRGPPVEASSYVGRLEGETEALKKIHGSDRVTCTSTGATYIKAQADDTTIVEFLHNQGVGRALKQFSSGARVLTVTAVPSSPIWMEAVPTDAGGVAPVPLRIRLFAGCEYPSRSAVLCRVQLEDTQGVVPAKYDRMLVVFEKLLLLKAIGTRATVSAREIVKDFLNHADEAMRQARNMYEEAMDSLAAKGEEGTLSDGPSLSPRPGAGNQPDVACSTKYVAGLHNLQMDGIDAMSLHDVAVEVLCSRCHKTQILMQETLDTRWTSIEAPCGGCQDRLSVSIHPRIIHASCNTIGILATSGCKPLDFLPSCSLEVQCDCTATRLMRNQFHQGRWNEELCRTCHLKNSFTFERCVFHEIGNKAAARGAGRGRASGTSGFRAGPSDTNAPTIYDADAPLLDGQPLPQTGTCVHYRHSHRWLRFPCCGRRFPCDLCHEQHTDGHEMKWAKSMVCGFCSLEQRVDSKCSGCGKKLATSTSNPNGRRTRFWEGGEGQRDKKRLSRKDAHKYRNSKAKTVSKKAFAAAKQ